MARKSTKPLFNPNEHLEPQIHLRQLGPKTEQNYLAAQAYYAQRRAQLQSLISNNMNIVDSTFEEITRSKIQKLWEQGLWKIMWEAFKDRGNITIQDIRNKMEQNSSLQHVQIPPGSELEKYLIEALAAGNSQQFRSKLGMAYEQFLPLNIINPIIEGATMFKDGHTSQLINSFVMGTETSLSTMTKVASQTRTDIMLGCNISLSKSNKVLQDTKTQLPIEFHEQLLADNTNIFPFYDNPMERAETVLGKYIEYGGQMFGFQVKLFKNINDNRWMNSSMMAAQLNSIFNQRDSVGGRHNWGNYYINPYVVYHLSHYLFHIINPVNVAMITSNNIYWMDEILQKHVFYMNVQISQNDGRHKAKNENYSFPQIKNDQIRFGQMNYGNLTAGFKDIRSKKRRSKGNNYINFSLKSK